MQGVTLWSWRGQAARHALCATCMPSTSSQLTWASCDSILRVGAELAGRTASQEGSTSRERTGVEEGQVQRLGHIPRQQRKGGRHQRARLRRQAAFPMMLLMLRCRDMVALPCRWQVTP